ncbi:MAG: aminoacyl-tRNA hydrolase [Myxococcota bacterium]
MWLIVGLGNPGVRYVGTRHNVGFVVVDALAKAWNLPPFRLQFSGQASRGRVAEQEAVLLKPQTYMNRSGQSLQAAMTYHRIPLERVMVVHDDLDLPPEGVRIKEGGGNAGHNGLRDIATRVGAGFVRIRLGIGRPAVKGQEAVYVLRQFSPQELQPFTQQVTDAATAIATVLEKGIAAAQRQFHGKTIPGFKG